MPNPKAIRRDHTCTWCSLSFSKKEHLSRHMRSHTREKPFTCTTCWKAFSRKDTLLRHSRGHKPTTDAGTPGDDIGPDLHQPGLSMNDPAEVIPVFQRLRRRGSNPMTEHNGAFTSFALDHFPSQEFYQPPPTSSTNSGKSGIAQDGLAPSDSVPILNSNSSGLMCNSTSSDSNETSLNHIHDEDVWNTDLDPQISALLTNADLDLDVLGSFMMLDPPGLSSADCTCLNAERMDCNHQLTDSASHKEDSVRKHWFTFLGAYENGFFNPEAEGERTHVDEKYREVLYQRLQPRVLDDPLPSTEFLNLCIRMYFTRFNPIFPIVHVPTFRLSKKSSMLLLSICSLGSLLLGSDRAAIQGQNIFDRLSKAALASWDKYISRGKSEALSIVQSALIGHTFALLSGRPRDLLTVQSFHGTIIAWARKYAIFQEQQRTEDNSCDMSGPDLETAWKSWAQVEEQKRLAVALYIHDSEYSALLKTEPLMRYPASKVPLICAKSLWEAPTAEAWRRTLAHASKNADVTQRPPPSELTNLSTSTLRNPKEQDPFNTYCELEGIAASIFEAKELQTWSNISSQLEVSLIEFYDNHLRDKMDGAGDALCLEILWHSVFISLHTDLNRLEICSGREGYEASREHSDYVRSWADSQNGQRCALHGVLILRKSRNIPLGSTPAIHLPRVLYCATMVWYCYTEFGQNKTTEIPGDTGKFSELEKLGINCQKLLFEAHGFNVSRPTKLESSTLYELVDLLRRQGYWAISRKLASLMSLLVYGDTEGEAQDILAQVY